MTKTPDEVPSTDELPDDVAELKRLLIVAVIENTQLLRKLGEARGALYEIRNEAGNIADTTKHPQPHVACWPFVKR